MKYKAVIIRLFPNKQQNIKMWQAAGVARWTWNWALALNKAYYATERRVLDAYALRREFTKMRNSGFYPWLKDTSAHISYNVIRDLWRSYQKFYARMKNGQRGGLPRFKVSVCTICASSSRMANGF